MTATLRRCDERTRRPVTTTVARMTPVARGISDGTDPCPRCRRVRRVVDGAQSRTRAARTRTTSTSSSRGASAADARIPPRSTTARCAATSRTSRRAGSARPTIARKAAAVRAYVRFLRRHGCADPRCRRRPPHARRAARSCRGAAPDGRGGAAGLGHGVASIEAATEGAMPRVARRDLAVLELLYGAGLRVSECCGLDVGDVDLPPADGHRARQGRQGPPAPARRAGVPKRSARTSGTRARRCWSSRPTALFVNARGNRLTPRDARRVLARLSARRRPDAASPLRCGTRSRLIFSKEVPI